MLIVMMVHLKTLVPIEERNYDWVVFFWTFLASLLATSQYLSELIVEIMGLSKIPKSVHLVNGNLIHNEMLIFTFLVFYGNLTVYLK